MRSRRRTAKAIARLLAIVVLAALTGPAVRAQALDGVTFQVPPELSMHMPRMTVAARVAINLLQDWFGPLPTRPLTIVATSWRGGGVASRGGIVNVPLRWLAPVRDESIERALIVALADQYWLDDAGPAPFRDALAAYVSTRAIHHVLEGSNFASPRFFGGHASFPLRSVLLSPPVGDPRPRVTVFDGDDSAAKPDLSRRLLALQTLERYVGWPTMLQALSRLRREGPSRWNPQALAEALSDARGTDMRLLVGECFRDDAVFDYAVDGLQTTAAGGQFESVINVSRRGNGRFAAAAAGERDATIPVRVRFADGREMREFVDGAAPSVTLRFTAPAAAVSAAVDPEVMLVIDANRENNAIVTIAGRSKLGIRLAIHWLAWLQNTMLSYTALV